MKKVSTLFLVRIFALFLLIAAAFPAVAQTKVKKVVFQAFWWDYWNENYRFKWADYLAEMAPRLKAMGVNTVWIPPAYKNSNPDFVGYMPFDNYDLGDKRQKGNGHPLNDRLRTRVGSKDELLRMIAVMHANGIEVIHDIVLNHNGDAGGGVLTNGAPGAAGTAGAGGQDPNGTSMLTASGFKNFRYVSYATPAVDETANDYWTRSGRWAKNWQNFYSCTSSCNEINSMYWGPDIDYTSTSVGQSSNIPTSGTATVGGVARPFHNPAQANNYMTDNARNWLLWLKKQTGSDGWRWDAVKHFPISVQETGIWHSKYDPSLSVEQAGGQDMFCVGEWIGNQNDIDAYANNISSPTAPGGVSNEKHTGTFDFGLRGYNSSGNAGIYGMVTFNGGYNMADLPAQQQSFRFFDYPGGKRVHRSVNFVNSHDTYRPKLQSNGNFLSALGVASGWNTSSELGGNGQHIDPREPRLFAAYAACMAMDGNPLVFFEDLFDVGTTGKRYSHFPWNTTDLPNRGDITNLIQCHQALGFKDGDYGVPSAVNSPVYSFGSSSDHVVFERVGKAIIGVSDYFNAITNNNADQTVEVKINDAWPQGTVLYDYSGAHGTQTITVPANRRITVRTAPVGHIISGVFGHGYSVWAPAPPGVTVTSVNDLYNYLATYNSGMNTQTTQEWELADDLGDSHCESLGQGGHIPANSTNQRVAGKIFVQANQQVNLTVTGEVSGNQFVVSLMDLDGVGFSSSGTSPFTASFTPTVTGWYTIKLRSAVATQTRQKAWIKATYTAPSTVDTRNPAFAVATRAAIWTGNKGTNNITDCGNWEEGIMPSATRNMIVPGYSSPQPVLTGAVLAKDLILWTGANLQIGSGATLTLTGNVSNSGGQVSGAGTLVMAGTTQQSVSGADLTVTRLQVNNANNVNLNTPISISTALTFTAGKIIMNSYDVTLGSGASVTGAGTNTYLQTSNTAATGGKVISSVGSTPVTFPVGNTRYSPVTLTNTGTSMNFIVRAFEGIYANGTSGAALTSTGKVAKTWVVDAAGAGANVAATFQWASAEEEGGFNRNAAFINKNSNSGSSAWQTIASPSAAGGTDPYTLTAMGITSFSSFAVASDLALLPLNWVSFEGKNLGKDNNLTWATANEVNTKGFAIERSTDGTNFIEVGYVNSATTNSAVNKYQFTDKNVPVKAFYRLRQEDKDGKIAYSRTILLQLNTTRQFVKIAPNPTTGIIELMPGTDLPTSANVSVEVVDAKGVRLATYAGSFATVKQAVSQSLVSKAPGLYVFIIRSNDQLQHIKILKQ